MGYNTSQTNEDLPEITLHQRHHQAKAVPHTVLKIFFCFGFSNLHKGT